MSEISATLPLSPRPARPVRRLDAWVAERIAAGEVIERPSSVVKELVENSLDAGASEIQVDLEDGGKALIRVTDNGHGMTADDLRLAVERHATSKVESLDDLDRIATLGFRGEALPSIAAASDFVMVSRARGAQDAFALNASDKSLEPTTTGHFLHAPNGTRVEARGLFAQIPARLKFLKSAHAEVAQVRDWMERLALAYPAVGFKLTSDERTLLQLRPESERDRVRGVLAGGEDFPVAFGELPLAALDQAFVVRAYWIQGLSLPHTRRLAQVVNGRALRDRLLQQAILQPFKQALLPGQFPAVALFISVPPATIDVNVHPTKTEIRFLDSSKIFRAVAGVVERMIDTHGAPAVVPIWAPGATLEQPLALSAAGDSITSKWTDHPVQGTQIGFDTRPSTLPTQESALPTAFPPPLSTLLRPELYLGIIFRTYLLYDLDTEMVLVDQHAAHERIRYERLKHQVLRAGAHGSAAPPAQQLLLPEVVHFDSVSRNQIEANLGILEGLGFDADLLGEASLVFRAVPTAWAGAVKPGSETAELRTRLSNLVSRLIEASIGASGESPNQSAAALVLDESLFERLASDACHGSVRAGDRLERAEALALVAQLWECSHPWNCPHGRPTIVRIPRLKFEEWFQRKV